MATIRNQILSSLVQRLATIPTWVVQRRAEQNSFKKPVTAIVFALGTEQEFANSDYYDVTMTVGVEIAGSITNVDDDLDGDGTPGSGNCYSYLDRLVAAAEKVIHAPDSWPDNPGFSRVTVNGHDVADPPEGDEQTMVQALLRLTFVFRQAISDPEVGQS